MIIHKPKLSKWKIEIGQNVYRNSEDGTIQIRKRGSKIWSKIGILLSLPELNEQGVYGITVELLKFP